VGDPDIIATPMLTNYSLSPFLNQTDINLQLQNNSLVLGTSPRWLIFGIK
jgi:hypothetical protein